MRRSTLLLTPYRIWTPRLRVLVCLRFIPNLRRRPPSRALPSARWARDLRQREQILPVEPQRARVVVGHLDPEPDPVPADDEPLHEVLDPARAPRLGLGHLPPAFALGSSTGLTYVSLKGPMPCTCTTASVLAIA